MKKILFLLVLIYSYSFSATNTTFEAVATKMSQYYYTTDSWGYDYHVWQVQGSTYWKSSRRILIDFNKRYGIRTYLCFPLHSLLCSICSGTD